MTLLGDLEAIGFTEYEARVYLALLRENPTTGYQLSKKAGIPRSMVYEALGRLDARGAVLKAGGERVTLYRPLPPEVLLDRFDSERSVLSGNLRIGLRELYTSTEEEHFWSIQGRRSALSYAGKMLQESKAEALLLLADSELEPLRAEIDSAAGRGVTISAVLTGEAGLDHGHFVRHPRRESELQELTNTLVVVTDTHEALIADSRPEMTATITRNRNLVLIARQFVWMELFAQRVYTHLGADVLSRLEPDDRRLLESFSDSSDLGPVTRG